jgi:hypothetical protein
MAAGLKKTKAGGSAPQVDQASHPQTVTFADSGSTTATKYIGGVAGQFANTTQLAILVNYKTSAGTAKTDGQIIRQRGRKQFDVQGAADGVSSLTRCTLVASGTLAASQMYIKAVAPDGTAFYASRITNRFVWNGDTRYPYVIVDSTQLSYIDSQSGVTFTNAAGATYANGFAVVEGA